MGYYKNKRSTVFYTPERSDTAWTYGVPATKDGFIGGVTELTPNKNEYTYVEDYQLHDIGLEAQRYWKNLKKYGGTLAGNIMVPTIINYLIGDKSYSVSGAGPYTHTLTPQNDMLPSCSLTAVKYGGGSTDYTVEYTGATFDVGTFEVKPGETIKHSYDWVAQGRDPTESAVSTNYASGSNKEPYMQYSLKGSGNLDATNAQAAYYMWNEATLTMGGAGGSYRLVGNASATNVPFTELTLIYNNNLDVSPESDGVNSPEISQPVPQLRTYEMRVRVKLKDEDATEIAKSDQANENLSDSLALAFTHSSNDSITFNFSNVAVFAPDPPINVANGIVLMDYTLRPATCDNVTIKNDINKEFWQDPDTA